MDGRPGRADVPETVRAAVAEELGQEPEHRRDLFTLRLEHWWPDLDQPLREVYGAGAADLAVRVVRLAAAAYRERDPELSRLDQVRTLDPDWFQSPSMLGYAAYADRFAGTLRGVRDHLEHLEELGVTYLHLMPLLRPREGDSDGGYAVADYRAVRADLGDLDDLCDLARALRGRGISLVLDLVLNHVAREHPWARAARAGDERYRRYFRIFPDRAGPDSFEATLPEVFPDFAPGNFTWDEDLDGWVWTTFNAWQWDVDWSNPDVFAEYTDIILFLAGLGVEVLRLDAIAFLWKRLGTDCQNQPEVHAITQALRSVARIACPAVLFKAEAIVAPARLVGYLGEGARHGKVSDLAYHNSLMVQIWSMLASGDVRLAARALGALPGVPASTAWVTYVRCHDDIGWAVDDADAAAVGLSGPAHRAFLSEWYSGSFPGSTARGLVFQFNPATGDRRISGTSAALAGLEAATGAGDDDAIGRGVARVLLAHAVAFGWGGVPVLWSGDELGLPNDQDWAREPGHEGDNRWAHRPRLPWERVAQVRTPGTVEARVHGGLCRLARARAALPHLDASVPARVLEPSDPAVLAVLREHPRGPLLELFNVAGSWRGFPGDRVAGLGLGAAPDVLHEVGLGHGGDAHRAPDGTVWLPPFGAAWLVATPDGAAEAEVGETPRIQ